jgi:hypothetical protein
MHELLASGTHYRKGAGGCQAAAAVRYGFIHSTAGPPRVSCEERFALFRHDLKIPNSPKSSSCGKKKKNQKLWSGFYQSLAREDIVLSKPGARRYKPHPLEKKAKNESHRDDTNHTLSKKAVRCST